MEKLFRKGTSVKTAINMVEPSIESQTNSANERKQSIEYSFEYGLRPFYYLSRVFGFMPFTIICDANGQAQEPKVKRRDLLWLGVSITSYLLLGFVLLSGLDCSQYSNTSKFILVLSEDVLAAVIIIYGIFGIGMDMCIRFKLVDILKKFTMFDAEVS